jgi:hypothetical protein
MHDARSACGERATTVIDDNRVTIVNAVDR